MVFIRLPRVCFSYRQLQNINTMCHQSEIFFSFLRGNLRMLKTIWRILTPFRNKYIIRNMKIRINRFGII